MKYLTFAALVLAGLAVVANNAGWLRFLCDRYCF